jgi:hypothetical protein
MTRTISVLPLRKLVTRAWDRDRQGRMGCGERGHVKDRAIGGQPAMKIIAVPGGHALGTVVGVLFGNIDPARKYGGLPTR